MANLKVTLVKSTIGAVPVSYTHLDVYKRQDLRWQTYLFTISKVKQLVRSI